MGLNKCRNIGPAVWADLVSRKPSVFGTPSCLCKTILPAFILKKTLYLVFPCYSKRYVDKIPLPPNSGVYTVISPTASLYDSFVFEFEVVLADLDHTFQEEVKVLFASSFTPRATLSTAVWHTWLPL